MMVKICGITNPEDARAAIEGGASAIGFNFYPKSPRYLRPADAARVIAAAGDWRGCWKVGVFVNEPPRFVESVVHDLGLDVAQLHGDERRDELPRVPRVWKAFRAGEDFDPSWLDGFPAEAFVIDAPSTGLYGGSGEIFAWERARVEGFRIVLAGGLHAGNVGRAIGAAQPWGVDACSRLERAPGHKDHFKLREFLRAAL